MLTGVRVLVVYSEPVSVAGFGGFGATAAVPGLAGIGAASTLGM